jgi:hypothetical protein
MAMDRETWLRRILEAIGDLADERYQEGVWVRGEGPEVDSSTEAICRLVDDYDLRAFLDEAAERAWVSSEQLAALRKLHAALARYAINGENADDATRIQSPGWHKICELAKSDARGFHDARSQRLTASGSSDLLNLPILRVTG